jgi:hypothetical protein
MQALAATQQDLPKWPLPPIPITAVIYLDLPYVVIRDKRPIRR